MRAGAGSSLPLLGRPSCMALPAALAHGTVSSLGCIGNRVYTGLGEDELYVVVPGAKARSSGRGAGNYRLGERGARRICPRPAGIAVHV